MGQLLHFSFLCIFNNITGEQTPPDASSSHAFSAFASFHHRRHQLMILAGEGFRILQLLPSSIFSGLLQRFRRCVTTAFFLCMSQNTFLQEMAYHFALASGIVCFLLLLRRQFFHDVEFLRRQAGFCTFHYKVPVLFPSSMPECSRFRYRFQALPLLLTLRLSTPCRCISRFSFRLLHQND